MEIPAGLASVFDALDDWERALEEAESGAPKQFTFNGTTYEHIPGTETFKLPTTPIDENGTPLESITALQIMKQQFKPTRSLYRRITPINSAETMFLLGDSARFKIMRAVQLHDCIPPITDETRQFTPFFQFFSTGVEDHWMVQQQYSSCKWASPKDEELATSLLLHYGWVQKFPDHRIDSCCIYQMRRAEDGIHIIFSEPHTFNDRLFAACTRAHAISNVFEGRNHHAPYDLLFKEACRVFFSYNRYYVSMTADYRQAIMNKIQAFCLRLTNALGDHTNPEYPTTEEPENIMEVQYDEYGEPIEYILKWEDFLLEDRISSIQQTHINTLAHDKNLTQLLKGFEKLDVNGEYTNAELQQVFTDHVLSKARKSGYLVPTRKVGRYTYWKLNYERS